MRWGILGTRGNRVFGVATRASVRWVIFVWIVGVHVGHVEARTAVPVPEDRGADVTVILDAYREALYRLPSPIEIQDWQSAVDAGQSDQSLLEVLQASEACKKVRYHRREEARDLRTSIIPLMLIFILTYVLLVRKRPDRILLFAVFVFAFTPIALDLSYVYQKSHFGDFPSFYYGADYIYNQGLSPYGTVLSEQVDEHVFPFFHPPFSVLIFAPLAHMSYNTAIIVSNLGNQIALCLLLYFLIIRKRKDSLVLSVCMLVYVLNFYPVRMTLDYGQINLWTTVFICVFIHAYLSRNSHALTGLSLAAAIILKIYPACLLAYLILKRQWKALAWCAAGVVGCVVIGLFTIPWPIWEAWWEAVGSRGGLYGTDGPTGIFSPAGLWNQGLNGLLMRIFTDNQFNVALIRNPTLGRALSYGLALLTVGVGGGVLWWRHRRHRDDAEELEIGLVLVMMALIVPLSWVHHSVMLLPAIVAGARQLWIAPRRWTSWLFILSVCFLAWDWSCLPEENFRLFLGGESLLMGSMRAFGLIGLLITILAILCEPWRASAPSGTDDPCPVDSGP